jgi:hypothetical protein
MKKINRWLMEHGFFWEEDDEKAGLVRLYALIITFVLFVITGIIFPKRSELIICTWAGIVTFAAPVIAGIKALVTKTTWNPWYWFPIVKGSVVGGLIAMLIVWIVRMCFGI